MGALKDNLFPSLVSNLLRRHLDSVNEAGEPNRMLDYQEPEIYSPIEARKAASSQETVEIPPEYPDPPSMFSARFVATHKATKTHGIETILLCLAEVRELARAKGGIYCLQMFRLPDGLLWIVDSDFRVTALLPEEF